MELFITFIVSNIQVLAVISVAISAIIVAYMAYRNCRLVNALADLAITRVEASRSSRVLDSSSRICDSLLRSQLKQKL